MNRQYTRRGHTWPVRIGVALAAMSCCVAACPAHAEDTASAEDSSQKDADSASRFVRISWSDGATAEGTLTMTPGAMFQLVTVAGEGETTGQLRTFTLDRVSEIAFVPFTSGSAAPERMVRGFTGTAAASKEPEFQGDPYPVRELGANVRFIDGEELFGVLRSCAIYLKSMPAPDARRPGRVPPRPTTRKLLLKSRVEGKPGSTLDDLISITHIRLQAASAEGPSRMTLNLPTGAVRAGDSVTALIRTSLESVPVTADDAGLSVRSTLGENILVAIQRADGSVDVGWPAPAESDEKLRGLIEKAVALQADYYDERRLVGVVREGPSRALALVSLRRTGADTNDRLLAARDTDGKADVRPTARASVWMFRVDDGAGRVALVRRGTFVRQKVDFDQPTPEVRPTPALWPITRGKDRITAGGKAEDAP